MSALCHTFPKGSHNHGKECHHFFPDVNFQQVTSNCCHSRVLTAGKKNVWAATCESKDQSQALAMACSLHRVMELHNAPLPHTSGQGGPSPTSPGYHTLQPPHQRKDGLQLRWGWGSGHLWEERPNLRHRHHMTLKDGSIN